VYVAVKEQLMKDMMHKTGNIIVGLAFREGITKLPNNLPRALRLAL
jgi:hypothetical protein